MISSQTASVLYSGNGSTSIPYIVPFRFINPQDLVVTLIHPTLGTSVLVYGTDYSVSGVTPDGGNLKTTLAYPAPYQLSIRRNTPLTQPNSYEVDGKVPMKTIEANFDLLEIQMQDLNEKKQSNFVSGAGRLLGRKSVGGGPIEEIVVGTGLTIDNGVLKNTGVPGPVGPPYNPPGPFVDDVQAAANGVPIGGVYRLRTNSTPRAILTFRQPVSAKIWAFIGDSMTAQAVGVISGTPVNGVGNFFLHGIGYATQLRRLFDCQFDFVPNGATLNFATPGYTTGQIRSVHLPQLLASSAQIVCDMSGVNDAITSVPLQTTLDNWAYNWTQIYMSGKIPIAIGVAPVGYGYNPSPGNYPNATGQISARIIALRAAQKALAASLNVAYVDVTGINETQPGNAVADPQFTYDELHQNIAGATNLARAVYPLAAPQVDPDINNFNNTDWITTNANFSFTQSDAYGSRPAPFNVSVPTGAIYTHQLVTDGTRKIWKIQFDTSGVADPDTRIELYNEFSPAQDPSSKILENVISYDLRSGYLDSYRFSNGVGTGSSGTGQEWNYPKSPLQKIYVTGRKRTLRTQRYLTSAGITYFNIAFSFTGVGEIWIYDNEFGTRVYHAP